VAPPALACEGLGKRYGARWALRGATLALAPGEVAALVGPNGSGKSTLLRCAATLLRPSEGKALVAGVDGAEDGPQARARLGFAGDAPRLYGDLSVEENLAFAARFHPGAAPRVPALLADVGLRDRAQEPARALSRGMAMRLTIARALVGDPALLLLDEPLGPLDAAAKEQVLGLLARASAQGTAVLFSTQSLDALPQGCDRVLVLREGALALDHRGSPPALQQRAAEALEGKAP
jgi:ABC-type multidrug transport system ATPase subunit